MKRVLMGLVTLLTPVVIVLLAVRIILVPWFVNLEYLMPGFPEDRYGFTLEERLKYADIARKYILSDPAVPSLADQRFPEGQQVPAFSCQFMDDCSFMYNEREVQHMLDVRNTVGSAMLVLGGALLAWVALGIVAWRAGWKREYRLALRRGGWLTLIAIGGVILFVLLAFGVIFVYFHQVFFQEGTWTFYYSDTLIRLFPERFWRDALLVVGFFTVVLSGAVIKVSKLNKHDTSRK